VFVARGDTGYWILDPSLPSLSFSFSLFLLLATGGDKTIGNEKPGKNTGPITTVIYTIVHFLLKKLCHEVIGNKCH